MPQAEFVGIGGKIPMDFIGRFERLNDDFEFIRQRLSLDIKLGLFNSTPHDSYGDLFCRESAAVVEEIYDKDFLAFGYKKLL